MSSVREDVRVKLERKSLIKYGLVLMFGIMYILLLVYINTPKEGDVPTAASKVIFEKAHVSDFIYESASPDEWTEGLRLGTQEVLIELDSGEFAGTELHTYNYMGAYNNIDLEVGSKIIVRLDIDEANNPYVLSINSYNRLGVLMGLSLLFIGVLVVFGGKKGISAILGLAFTIISIWFFLIPLIIKGYSPIMMAILLIAITTFVALFFLNGLSKKTIIAAIGCIGGVAIAGLVAYLAGKMTPLTGFNMMEAEELVLRGKDGGLTISGLLVSGILIASLGAIMDVSLMIVSAIWEIHEINPKVAFKTLLKSGLNIGQDAMGTMANTLILAFAGTSLNMLILFRVFDYPYLQIFNSDMMVIEIIQGLSGSIGIVLTVPLVALISAFVFSEKDASVNGR